MHLEKFWPLILFALIGLIRTLMAKSAQSQERGPSSPTPAANDETDTDRMRKFMEALGQPSGAEPPPKVRPRNVPAEMRRMFNPLPLLTTKPTIARLAKPAPVVTPVLIPAGPPGSRVEVIPEDADDAQSPGLTNDSLRALLATPQSLRQAVILREVLGPPRALSALGASYA